MGHSKLAAVQARIESELMASGFDSFLVLSLTSDPMTVNQRLKASPGEAPQLAEAGFRAGTCSTYQAVGGIEDFSICRVSRISSQ